MFRFSNHKTWPSLFGFVRNDKFGTQHISQRCTFQLISRTTLTGFRLPKHRDHGVKTVLTALVFGR